MILGDVSKRRKSTLSPRKSYELESFIRRTLIRRNDKTYVLTLNTVINELMGLTVHIQKWDFITWKLI